MCNSHKVPAIRSRLFQSLLTLAEEWVDRVVYIHIFLNIYRYIGIFGETLYHKYSWRYPCIYVFIFPLCGTTMMLCVGLAPCVCGGRCSEAYLPQLRRRENRLSKSSFSLGGYLLLIEPIAHIIIASELQHKLL